MLIRRVICPLLSQKVCLVASRSRWKWNGWERVSWPWKPTSSRASLLSGVETLSGRDFLRVTDLARPELEAVLDLAADLKDRQHRREEHRLLPGRTVGRVSSEDND